MGKCFRPRFVDDFENAGHFNAMLALLFSIFVCALGVGALEVRIARIATTSWNWPLQTASLYTAGVFSLFLPLMYFVGRFSRGNRFPDRIVVIVSFSITS